MENESFPVQPGEKSVGSKKKHFFRSVLKTQAVRYIFMVGMLSFVLLCGYLLFYSGSLFIEAVMNGWYSADAGEFEHNSFWLGYLYSFSSLLGLLGGLTVMATKPSRLHKFKILLFIPAAIWSTLLVLDLMRRSYSLTNWFFWTLHIVAMLLCFFVFFGVIAKICMPYLDEETFPAVDANAVKPGEQIN